MTQEDTRLFPGEWLEFGAGFPALCRFLAGDRAQPLLVFIPGGGFLGRVAYGHPGADPAEFLAHWLAEAGLNFLAQSFPSDHPAFGQRYPYMTIDDWGCSAAEIASAVAARHGLGGDVVLVGWSMAGRMAPAFARHAARLGLRLAGFIGIAANAPLPGLAPLADGVEALTPDLLWDVLGCAPDSVPFGEQWQAALTSIGAASGEPLFSAEICRAHYFANCPINFRGEASRLQDGAIARSLDAAMADMGSVDFATHPLSASIVPLDASDAKHALTDQSTYAFFNSRAVFQRASGARHVLADQEDWNSLRLLVEELPRRLTRFQEGGHFCFIGRAGAETAAKNILSLIGELYGINSEIDRLTTM